MPPIFNWRARRLLGVRGLATKAGAPSHVFIRTPQDTGHHTTRGPRLAFELFFKNELGETVQPEEVNEFADISFMHAGCNWFHSHPIG